MLKKIDKALLLILVGGLILRIAGLTHGFPFIFHPDEPAVVRSALGIRFDSNPGHFDWPHLHFYLNFILYWVYIKFRGGLQILGLQGTLSSWFPLLWRDPLIFYALGRVLSALMGTLTAIPVYLAGKKLFDRRAGLIAAAALLLIPHHVRTSAFALIDIPTAFWVAWAFYFTVKIFQKKDIKNYLWAGFFVGLAASTKYNGGLWAIMVPIAHILRTWKSKSEKVVDITGIKALVLSGLFAALAFVIGTPYSILDYDTFSRVDGPKGAFWQFANVGKADFMEQIANFFKALTYGFADNFGYVFIILYTLVAAYTVFVKREKKLLLIIIPSLLVFFYVSGFSKHRSHYFTSTYPFVALAVGYALHKFKRKYLVLALFLVPLMFSLQQASLLVKADTRVQMYDWMQENVIEEDNLYYNSAGMVKVLEKYSDNYMMKGFSYLSGEGYLLVGLDDDELADYYAGNHEDSNVEGHFDKLLELSNKGRDGPHIIIYDL